MPGLWEKAFPNGTGYADDVREDVRCFAEEAVLGQFQSAVHGECTVTIGKE